MTQDEYVSRDGTALAGLVRAGEVSALELIDAAMKRLKLLNPAVNAVVYRMDDEARVAVAVARSSGVFAGVPFLAKDLQSNYAGHPTSRGSRLLAARVQDADTELVRRVRATGVSVLGKTNVPEFGLLPYTEPELWGPCRNPWALDRTPGGSSGGSAAAVSAGITPIAGGGDGAGSIRMPASCCGLFGLKPTRGRIPTGPHRTDPWRGAAVEHVLTRSVRDSAAMLDATHGPEPGAPYRIAPPARPFAREPEEDPGPLAHRVDDRADAGKGGSPRLRGGGGGGRGVAGGAGPRGRRAIAPRGRAGVRAGVSPHDGGGDGGRTR